jgi:transcription elongation factor Elf1
MKCPYCKFEPVIISAEAECLAVVCGHCGRGPKEEFDQEAVYSGYALEAWTLWVRRILKRRKERKLAARESE